MNGLHFERLELKYFVPEARIPEIREFIAPYVRLDDFAAADDDRRYTIHNIYLDTPQLDFFRCGEASHVDRYKLRIRWYDEAAEGPFFLEVKRKVRGIVVKDRVFCTRDEVIEVLAGRTPHAATTIDRGDWNGFLTRMHSTAASPIINLRYTREPYESLFGDYARITFDRAICFHDVGREPLDEGTGEWRYVDAAWATKSIRNATMLELKATTGGVPRWMSALVEKFNLRQTGFSKYGTSIKDRLASSNGNFERRRFSQVSA